MYINFNNLRIGRYHKNGSTGFVVSLYDGKKKIGTAMRDDGKTLISDIQFTLSDNETKNFKSTLRNKRKVSIDNDEQKWTIELAIFCLIENHFIVNSLKDVADKGMISYKSKNEDYFRVLNISYNPQNLKTVKMNNDNIEIFGHELINNYESIKHA